jgi:hypothetical protein
MSALSPTPSSDDDWSSDCSSAAGPDAAPPRETDAARDLLVFAADKAGMQVQIGTIGTIGTPRGNVLAVAAAASPTTSRHPHRAGCRSWARESHHQCSQLRQRVRLTAPAHRRGMLMWKGSYPLQILCQSTAKGQEDGQAHRCHESAARALGPR